MSQSVPWTTNGGSEAFAGAPALSSRGHTVQFYEDESFLSDAVADFLAAGLRVGEPLLVIASEPHRDAFCARLGLDGFDVARLRREGRLVLLDARDTLATFMSGQVPDRDRFLSTMGATIERCARRRSSPVVRTYGEMVDLLWRDGNADGAIRLEELWNELATTHAFSLLCAYGIGDFRDESHAERLKKICHQHTHVFPTERCTQADDRARLVEIALLQQRARALETEIERRKRLEQLLRDALADRHGAEEARRASDRDLRDFLENAVEGLHWVGADGVILWANRAELELVGYSRDEYVGHHIAEFHADRDVVDEMLARLARKETLREFEAALRCKDGSIRHVLINSNVLWRNGEFVHTRCFTRDITELKRAAAERERLLEQERLARADAEAANRAKSEFLAIMSHELRTPLNAIGGYVQLIEMGVYGPVNDAQREALVRVERSQQHLLALINDLLNLVRIEREDVDYAGEEVPLEPLLTEVVRMIEPLLWERQLTCEIAPVPGGAGEAPLCARADQKKVHQILLNLLTNAIKFTPPGGHISMDAMLKQGTPATIAIRVRDNGIGIPVSKLESVFEPFVQLATRAVSQRQGLGLGLGISRDLARGMGGDLTASSADGEGSTFTLELPRA